MSTEGEQRFQSQQAQQRQRLIAWIEQTVNHINEALRVLDPDNQLVEEDDVDLSFSELAVGMFKSSVDACQKSLGEATEAVDIWDKLVDAHIVEISNELTKVQLRLGELAAEKEKQSKSAAALDEEVKKAKSSKDEAQKDYDKSLEAHSKALKDLEKLQAEIREREEGLKGWVIQLGHAWAQADGFNTQYQYNNGTIGVKHEAKKAEETMKALESVLAAKSNSLEIAIFKWKMEDAALVKTTEALQNMVTEKESLSARKTSLEADSRTTKDLKCNTYNTKDIIGEALGYGGAINIGMSLTCVRDNVKSLLQTLGQESSFEGLVATVDASRLLKLDKAIASIKHLLQ